MLSTMGDANTLLRTRGGISTAWFYEMAETASSPHTRRYFLHGCFPRFSYGLFSAHAEVFPTAPGSLVSLPPLLRTRGGISLAPR